MRLTLRTLLAYMDEILEPEDQETLSKKIETSEFASDLIHRTRDTMRRLRLSAPQVVGTGLGLDPNTVAEYLDNTLPVENVADLERICLESDIHLAEVGSCHHVLTMVLGEPAEIDPATKQRMYRIAEEGEQRKRLRIESAHAPMQPTAPVATTPPVVPTGSQPARPASSRSEVPDYLRASRQSAMKTFAQVFVAAAILAGVAFLGINFFASRNLEVADGPSGLQQRGLQQPSGLQKSTSGSETNTADVPEVPAPVTTTEITPPKPQVLDTTIPENGTSEVTPKAVPLITPSDLVESNRLEESSPIETPQAEPILLGSAASSIQEPAPMIETSPPVAIIPNDTTSPENRAASVPVPVPMVSTEPETPVEEPLANDAAEDTPPAPVSNELGTFWADGTVLLRRNSESGDWFPLASGSNLEVGDQLMSLPTFRPTIALHSGVWVVPSGAAILELVRNNNPNDGSVSGVRLISGKAVLINTTDKTSSLQLEIGTTSAISTLGPNAGIAVMVNRSWFPGYDPQTNNAPIEATVYAPMGEVTWDDGVEARTIAQPSKWQINESGVADLGPLTAAIEWLEEEPATRTQLLAADEIEKRLQPTVPAGTVFLEMRANRRKEVRSMASECSAFVGQFVPFVRALNDSDQHQLWGDYIATMRTALSLNPATAEKLQHDLAELRGSQAAEDMFKMICGYARSEIGTTAEETQTGSLPQLINWLEDESLDYRVLASYNLREITGKNLMSDPAGSPSDRAQGVRRWRKRLEEGELLPLATYGP